MEKIGKHDEKKDTINATNDVKSLETGNTNQSLNSYKKKQDTQRVYWFLTWNNYKDTDIDLISKFFDKFCVQAICEKEIGTSGTKHLQGCFTLNNKMRMLQIKSLIGSTTIHLEPTNNVEAAIKYCGKDNTVFYRKPSLPEEIKDPLMGLTLYEWQENILALIKHDPDNRSINWFWETIGCTGKSSLCKHIKLMYPDKTITVSGKTADICHNIIMFNEKYGKYPKIILFDIPRSVLNYVNYQAIEKLKDGYLFSGKYEGGEILMNPPHIICFANEEPDMNTMSLDRWKITKIQSNG